MTKTVQTGFLNTGIKQQCLGCEACVQVCSHNAILFQEDNEGFRYPVLNPEACVECNLCHIVCPEENPVEKNYNDQIAFGGYIKDEEIRCQSTSGGAFSSIVETWCKENYVIFGAIANGLEVYHGYVYDKNQINIFRKSKYSQSKIGNSYSEVRRFLRDGKNVLFSGTPCQIAGLRNYLNLGKNNISNLLTIEVICEGVPSPLYIRKLDNYYSKKYGSSISQLDYRYKDGKYDINSKKTRKGRWDFEVMYISLNNGKILKKDRWFNPFWNIWLNHLMNRPSCYKCPYATKNRIADITLGDLWGVHIYCPELYGENGGSSLIVSNTPKGDIAVQNAVKLMYGHPLKMNDVLKFQSPMRKCISYNPERENFMKDLINPSLSYKGLTDKWAIKPNIKLLIKKYIWGNHQKVRLWKLKKIITGQ